MNGARQMVAIAMACWLCTTTAQAFTVKSGFSKSCHEQMSADAFSKFLDVPISPEFVVPSGGTWRKLADDLDTELLSVELPEAPSYILFSLVVGVRTPDNDGHSVSDLETLRSLHGDPRPEGQYLHALRGLGDDGPEGDVSAVAGIRASLRASVLAAVEATKKTPAEQNVRTSVALDFYNRFNVDVWEPAFLLGEAMHTLQDSFSHSIRSEATELHTIVHVLNFIEPISSDFDEERDGLAHSNHVDKCKNADVAQLVTAARTATEQLIQVFREVRDGNDAALDEFLDRWMTLEEGCTIENDFCGNTKWLAIIRQDPTDPYLPDFLVCSASPWRKGEPARTIPWLIVAWLALFLRRRRSGALLVVGVLCMCIGSSPVHADDTHYRGVPIGAHPVGLGTAFTGVADDASAAYHNPAGIVGRKTFGLAGGLTIIAFERFEMSSGFGSEAESSDLVNKGQRSVPLFVAAVAKFGPRDEEGNRRYAIGYSVAQPIFGRSSVDVTLPEGPMSDTLTLDGSDRASYFGLSFAARINPRHSIGVSTYLSLRKTSSREVEIVSAGGTMLGGSENFVDASLGARQTKIDIKSFHFVPRLGWLYQILPNLKFGAMLQLPGIPLKQRADVESQLVLSIDGEGSDPATSRFFYFDEELRARSPIPLELEVGVGYRPTDGILLAMDASFHAPVKDKSRIDLPSDFTGTSKPGFFFDTTTKRRAVVNLAIGGDFSLNKRIMLELGAFTDLSAAPKIESAPIAYQVPRVNRYGATASVGFKVSDVSLALGATGIFGRGQSTAALIDFENQSVEYTRSGAKSRLIFIHITGATQVVSKVEDTTEEWLERRTNDPNEKQEGYPG